MKKWALIKHNTIDMMTVQDEQPEVYANEANVWVEVFDDNVHIATGWKYENGVFTPPNLPTKVYNRLELINLLGNDYKNIIIASKTDVDVEIWLEQFRLSDNFIQTDSSFIESIDMLSNKNLINSEKANNILGRT